MALTIPVDSIPLDKLAGQIVRSGLARRGRVATYLDSIASDARLLAEIWRETWESRVGEYLEINERSHERAISLFAQDEALKNWLAKRPGNVVPHARLVGFYDQLSSIVGTEADPQQAALATEFLMELSVMLLRREIAVKKLERFAVAEAGKRELLRRFNAFDLPPEAMRAAMHGHLPDGEEVVAEFSDIITELEESASSLEVLAKTYRARPPGSLWSRTVNFVRSLF